MVIVTTYVPATDTEGAKICAFNGEKLRIVGPWRQNLSVEENHSACIREHFSDNYIGDQLYLKGEYIGWAWVRVPLS